MLNRQQCHLCLFPLGARQLRVQRYSLSAEVDNYQNGDASWTAGSGHADDEDVRGRQAEEGTMRHLVSVTSTPDVDLNVSRGHQER